MALTAAAKTALFAQETDKLFLTLVTITAGATVLRFVNDTKNITSNSLVYSAFPFALTFPPSVAEELAAARLVIDNVDRGITAELRAINTAPTVTLSVVLEDDPDNVQLGPMNFAWRAVQYNQSIVEGSLLFEELLGEGFPADRVTPSSFPGMF